MTHKRNSKHDRVKNCSDLLFKQISNLKIFANSRPSASNFKSFSRSLEHFFPNVGQNNFGNKIPFCQIRNLVSFSTQKYL